jgi:SAM-dependent methyltransferase
MAARAARTRCPEPADTNWVGYTLPPSTWHSGMMRIVEGDRKRYSLRAGFDQAAEDYHRTRPVCPPQVFDDLVRLAGLAPGDQVAEIGCGTGQATVPLAERGLAITAVELGAELAALARCRLTGFLTSRWSRRRSRPGCPRTPV